MGAGRARAALAVLAVPAVLAVRDLPTVALRHYAALWRIVLASYGSNYFDFLLFQIDATDRGSDESLYVCEESECSFNCSSIEGLTLHMWDHRVTAAKEVKTLSASKPADTVRL